MLGPLLFTAYISPIGRVVGGFGIKHHEYADDTQLYVEITDIGSPALALHQLSPALVSAQSPATQWKQVRRHHHWDTQRHARASQPTQLRVAESCVAVSDSLKLLGVTLELQ